MVPHGVARDGEEQALRMPDRAHLFRFQKTKIRILDQVIHIGLGRQRPAQVGAQRQLERLDFFGQPTGFLSDGQWFGRVQTADLLGRDLWGRSAVKDPWINGIVMEEGASPMKRNRYKISM